MEIIGGNEMMEEECRTPKNQECRIPEVSTCPPPPRKKSERPKKQNPPKDGYFLLPDLESLFVAWPRPEAGA